MRATNVSALLVCVAGLWGLLSASGCGPASEDGGDTDDADGGSADMGSADMGSADMGSADGGSADGGSGGAVSTECEDGMPWLDPDTGAPTGYTECGDGFRHRSQAVACPDVTTPATCDAGGACSTDAECTAAPGGRCLDGPDVSTFCECVYTCATDDDCASAEVCACASLTQTVPRCVPASCRTSADCDDGLCGLSTTTTFCGAIIVELACLDESSECRGQSCAPVEVCNDPSMTRMPVCQVLDGSWSCYDFGCVGGCG